MIKTTQCFDDSLKDAFEMAVSRKVEPLVRWVFFTMVETSTGWIRCGNAYASKEEAESWLDFVSQSKGGRLAKVEKLKLNFVDGMLDEETIRTLDEKFNLDAPNASAQPRGE